MSAMLKRNASRSSHPLGNYSSHMFVCIFNLSIYTYIHILHICHERVAASAAMFSLAGLILIVAVVTRPLPESCTWYVTCCSWGNAGCLFHANAETAGLARRKLAQVALAWADRAKWLVCIRWLEMPMQPTRRHIKYNEKKRSKG